MSDSSNRANIFGLYTARPATADQLPETERESYQGVELTRSGEPYCLRVYYPNGKIELIPYGLLLSVEANGPRDLGLLFNTGVVFLEGANLLDALKGANDSETPLTLLDALQLRRVWALRPFNADKHIEPAEGEPVIYNIKFETAASLQGQ
jgi:hypothetical protein